MIAIILFLNLTVYCQVTTKEVKISTLIKMGKDLEKCEKVIKPELLIKSVKLDSLVVENLDIFNELKVLRADNQNNNDRLEELNKSLLEAEAYYLKSFQSFQQLPDGQKSEAEYFLRFIKARLYELTSEVFPATNVDKKM